MHQKVLAIASELCALAFLSSAAMAQNASVALKNGESADVFPVYWIANCKSILKSFAGVDMLQGPSGLSFSLREEPVVARRQNCPEKVPGAMLVANAKDVAATFTGTAQVRVKYVTEDGNKQSLFTIHVSLFP